MIARIGIIILMIFTTSAPAIALQFPNAVWVSATNGRVPPKAIAQQYIDGQPFYSCRVRIGNDHFIGQLILNQGCKLEKPVKVVFSSYDVLSE